MKRPRLRKSVIAVSFRRNAGSKMPPTPISGVVSRKMEPTTSPVPPGTVELVAPTVWMVRSGPAVQRKISVLVASEAVDGGLDRVEETHEILMTLALRSAPNQGVF